MAMAWPSIWMRSWRGWNWVDGIFGGSGLHHPHSGALDSRTFNRRALDGGPFDSGTFNMRCLDNRAVHLYLRRSDGIAGKSRRGCKSCTHVGLSWRGGVDLVGRSGGINRSPSASPSTNSMCVSYTCTCTCTHRGCHGRTGEREESRYDSGQQNMFLHCGFLRSIWKVTRRRAKKNSPPVDQYSGIIYHVNGFMYTQSMYNARMVRS